MTKRDDFLFAVQTAFLINAVQLNAKPQKSSAEATYAGAPYAIGRMHEVFHAADRIPADMSAAEAARQFCFYMIDNLREREEEATGARLPIPAWFAM